jgi:hypothetical protein
MKIKVVGIERAEGVSTKTGTPKPYSMGQMHAMVPLEESGGSLDSRRSKGFMGATYPVSAELVKQIEELSFPFDAELTIQDVMRFGKRESKVMDVRPVGAPEIARDKLRQAA